MALLTDQSLASGVTLNDLVHIVITGNTSQNPAGSSFKATIGQVASAIVGLAGTSGTSGSDGSAGSNGSSGSAGTSGTSPVSPYPYLYGLFSQIGNSVAVSATTSEGTIIGSGVGTLSVPANGFSVGDSFTVVMSGHLGANNNDDLTIRIKSGSVVLGTIGPINLSAATNKHFKLNVYFTIRSIGAAGVASIMSGGDFSYSKDAAGNAFDQANFTNLNNSTFDTTSTNTLNITAQFDSSNAGNSIYSEIFVLNKVY